jgi:Icc-related predicted phosphoesterase
LLPATDGIEHRAHNSKFGRFASWPIADRVVAAMRGTLVIALLGCAALGCRPASPPSPEGWCALRGHGIAQRRIGNRQRLSIGAVADTRGAAPETMAALAGFAATFRAEHVDLVVALGDLGRREEDIAAVLTALGSAGAPILALAGDLEGAQPFRAAVARARAAGIDIIDGVDTRRLDTGAIDIVTVPGAPSDNECSYTATELAALAETVRGRFRPLVLVAHTPPRDEGDRGVDWDDGRNVGDRSLLDLINAVYPNVALFAHADDAGGRVRRTWINVGAVTRNMASIVELVDGLPHLRVLR